MKTGFAAVTRLVLTLLRAEPTGKRDRIELSRKGAKPQSRKDEGFSTYGRLPLCSDLSALRLGGLASLRATKTGSR